MEKIKAKKPFVAVLFSAGLLALCACRDSALPTAPGPHPVAVRNAAAAAGSITAVLPGEVSFGSGPGPGTSYEVRVALPPGAEAAVGKGAAIAITLPIVRSDRTTGAVTAVRPGGLDVLLSGQVQELNGQTVQAEVPLKAAGIYKVPLGAIVSPLGEDCYVFAVRGGRAERVPVRVLAPADDASAYVSGALRARDQVAVEGMDNLLHGDPVEARPVRERL
jgi:hypothetical protein